MVAAMTPRPDPFDRTLAAAGPHTELAAGQTEHLEARTVTAASLAAFVTEVQARGIRQVIVAVQQEYAQELPADVAAAPAVTGVVYDRLKRCWLLAYERATGLLVRAVLDGEAADAEALTAHLSNHGFMVERRSRNLG
jgi:hypothetical protein